MIEDIKGFLFIASFYALMILASIAVYALVAWSINTLLKKFFNIEVSHKVIIASIILIGFVRALLFGS